MKGEMSTSIHLQMEGKTALFHLIKMGHDHGKQPLDICKVTW